MTANAAERRGGRAFHVDLAVEVDLDRRVDREQRVGGQPAQIMGVLDGVKHRPAIGPPVQARTSGQVGGNRLADQETALVQVDHRLGQHPRIDPDRDPERAQQRGRDLRRPDL